jgi:hypothetical protein
MFRPRIPKLLPYESRGEKVLIFNYVPVFLLRLPDPAALNLDLVISPHKVNNQVWVTPGAFLTGIGEPIDFVVA